MNFSAQERTISHVFSLKRTYRIPRFQREYSWKKDQLQELWEDLIECLNFDTTKKCIRNSDYFLGSLVLVGTESGNERYFDVVDGQQRLMTLTVFFSVLSRQFELNGNEVLSKSVYDYIVSNDENGERFVRVQSESPKPFFQQYIQSSSQRDVSPATQEEERLLEAYKFFFEKLSKANLVSELKNKFPSLIEDYEDFLKVIRDQVLGCRVIHVTVDSFDDAYMVFEVLNAKGKTLSPLDIIKNKIFSVITDTIPMDSADLIWRKMRNSLESVGTKLDIFYRHYWLSHNSVVTQRLMVRAFNKQVKRDNTSCQNFLESLNKSSLLYSKLCQPTLEDLKGKDKAYYEIILNLNSFGITQIRILLLALFEMKDSGTLSHKQLLNTLKMLEQFHFVHTAVCSKYPAPLERVYSNTARGLRGCKNSNDSKEVLKKLKNSLNKLMPKEEEYITNFNNLRFTSKTTKDKKVVQYILKRYESYLSDTGELKIDSFSIEHILSEGTPGVGDYVGKIGNLLPLSGSRNSRLNDACFAVKIHEYQKSRYKSVEKFVTDFGSKVEWSEKEINERTYEIAKVLYSEFG